MKIAINATTFNDQPSGANQRFLGIYLNLFKIMPKVQFTIFLPSDFISISIFDSFKNVKIVKTLISSRSRFQKFFFGFFYWTFLVKDDFNFYEGFHLPFFLKDKNKGILTIHDVRGLYKYLFWYPTLYKFYFRLSTRKVFRILSVSDSIKKEMLYFYPNLKVDTLYNGIDGEFFLKELELNKFINRKIKSDFILSVGHFEKRKNFENLIFAFKKLKKEKKLKEKLIIIGQFNTYCNKLKILIENQKLNNEIIILNDVSNLELVSFYKRAKLFVFPSIYEGFGIPVLEAMASKCPLVVSDIPVFREITENKILYFDPYDIDSISRIIQLGLKINYKKKCVSYGLKRIKFFYFKEIAKRLKKLYANYKK